MPQHRFGPREFALAMIVVAIVSLILATIEHRRGLQAMRVEYGPVPYSLATVVAGIVGLLGLIGLMAVLYRG